MIRHYTLVLIGLVSLFGPASCANRTTTAPPAPPNAGMLAVSGELSYLARIALPPESIAVVELRDVSIADAPSAVVAEQRIELIGRQVPVVFRMTVDRVKLTAGRRYAVRGVILGPQQRLLWTTTTAHLIDPAAQSMDLGTLMMSQASSGQAPGTPGLGVFTATGNEPGWRLDIGPAQITLLMNNGSTRIVAPLAAPQITGNTRSYVTASDGRSLTATIMDQTCADNMSGMPHPNTVVVRFNGQELRGCGGDPATLLQGAEWVVEDINGAGMVEMSRGTLNFTADSAVAGRSFCNTYGGTYRLTGESLTIGLLVSTQMACASALMMQEKLFTDLLAAVRRFELRADGSLVLHTGDGRTITARRE